MTEIQGRSRPLLEVCVASLDDALAALAAGADRLELCSALEMGGLTPSIGLLKQVLAESGAQVVAMVRPRAGGFHYSEREFATMLADAEEALGAGAHGIVFGVLLSDGEVDRARIAELVDVASDRESVFHRAIDFTPDTSRSMHALVDSGVTRVLTSGGKPTALEGAATIRRLIGIGREQTQVLPGGGVRAANVTQILVETGCTQVHVGGSVPEFEPRLSADGAPSLADSELLAQGGRRVLDPAAIAAVVQQIEGSGRC
jgi:copper homeostasis protein